MSLKIQSILDDFARTTDNIISLEEFKEKLKSGRKLTIKYGADCTAAFLHLGHAVNLWMMRRLQEEGHKVVFLIGDFTTKIGDPTGRSKTRPILSDEDIQKNAEAFIEQIGKILITNDSEVFEIRRNSEWLGEMKTEKLFSLLSMVTHARLASRDMFQKRTENNEEIYIHEMLYPVLQGYDSVELKADLTIVGSDQLFNESMGRFYQERFGQSSQVIITTKITNGLCGKTKQSKSLGNYIALTDSSRDKFGKTMTLPDELILQWMEVYTDLSLRRIGECRENLAQGKINFRELKIELAKAIVHKYHCEEVAIEEEEWFIQTFSKRGFPDDAETVCIDVKGCSIFELLKLCSSNWSNSEIRKLISQGGVRINDEKVLDLNFVVRVDEEDLLELRIGKKHFYRVSTKIE